MKKSVLLGVTLAALSLPNVALAHCGGHNKGSFNVSCESGVQVYRHNALTAPSISPAQTARLENQRENRLLQRQAIASRERIASQRAKIANRRASTDEFFQRSLVERPSNLSRLGFNNFGNGFNNVGFNTRIRGGRFGFSGRRRGFVSKRD